jgi:N-acetylmuramic acid 6-phosphate etherase
MDHLTTEARNPASTNLDELTPLQLVRLMNSEDARVIPAVASQEEAIARAIDVIADRLRAGGRLIYVGAGTSGRLGVLDATECPPTFNSPPGQVIGLIAGGPEALTRAVEGAEDRPELAEQDLDTIGFGPGDALVGIATSGRTPYVLGALTYARRKGAYTVALSCNADSELAAAAELAITPVVGPEVLSGSTRLKAGTATKLVLNMLTTGAMVRLSKTFGNLMVDLRATNSKLRARTNRIVRILSGLSVDEATALLERCGGELKTALVVQQAGVTPEEARARLQAAGGQVRAATPARSASEGPTPARSASEGPSLALRAGVEDHRLLLGIDGGGTHTVALLAHVAAAGGTATHTVLGRGEAGPSNLQAVGPERALQALDEAVGRAFIAAGRGRCPVAVASFGLAGGDRPADQALIQEWARRVGLAGRVLVTNDAAPLLAAGTPQGWGVALIAGTGSIAYGRNATGVTARAGGWGYLLGDEGSGYALALAGLQAVVRAADGRGKMTSLTERLLGHWGLRQPQELVPAVYRSGRDRAALAALGPLVLAAAEEGDAVAAELVTQAAGELAGLVAAVVRQLGLPPQEVPLALAGGLLVHSIPYRQAVLRGLASLALYADPVTPVPEPAEGALRIAQEVVGLPVGQ